MPVGIENLNTPEEGGKEFASTHARSRILENAEEIGNDIILLAKTSNEISTVCSLGGMQIVYDNDKFFNTYKKLLDKYKKGEHNGIRWVTSIVGVKLEKDDIELIKTFLDLGMQIRHVKNLSLMNFSVSDKMLNATIEKLEGGKMVQSLLTSHDPNYVHHFYSMFEQLWDNGIDAADRIEDIEGGIEFAARKVIQNSKAAIIDKTCLANRQHHRLISISQRTIPNTMTLTKLGQLRLENMEGLLLGTNLPLHHYSLPHLQYLLDLLPAFLQ